MESYSQNYMILCDIFYTMQAFHVSDLEIGMESQQSQKMINQIDNSLSSITYYVLCIIQLVVQKT